jgi:hypothetical protein
VDVHGPVKAALVVTVMLATVVTGCQSHSSTAPTTSTSEAAPPTIIKPSKSDTPVIGLPPGTDSTTLQPDSLGQLTFYTDKSQKIACQIEEDQKYEIACYGPFTNTPQKDGKPLTGVLFTREGEGMYVPGTGDLHPVLTLDDRTYYVLGWTVTAREDGSVAFLFLDTGHRIDVSVEKITAD